MHSELRPSTDARGAESCGEAGGNRQNQLIFRKYLHLIIRTLKHPARDVRKLAATGKLLVVYDAWVLFEYTERRAGRVSLWFLLCEFLSIDDCTWTTASRVSCKLVDVSSQSFYFPCNDTNTRNPKGAFWRHCGVSHTTARSYARWNFWLLLRVTDSLIARVLQHLQRINTVWVTC